MNIYQEIFSWIQCTIRVLYPDAVEHNISKIVVEPTKDPSHGDVSTNAAMVLAKPLGVAPKQLGATLIEALKKNPDVMHITLADPGFINITFSKEYWLKNLTAMVIMGENFGKPSATQELSCEKFLVEYVSVNPTGPLHAGHGRNAILGDTIASLLAFYGYSVTREYYINDAGGQVDALARSVYLRYCEALGRPLHDNAFTQDMYGGDYLIPAGSFLAAQFKDQYLDKAEDEWLEPFKSVCVDLMMQTIKDDLTFAGIKMDVYTSEKEIAQNGIITDMLNFLKTTGDAYIGILEPPKGITVEDWEEKPQTLFKAIAYGDDVDRVLKKSNGAWTYFAGDAAYHFEKYQRGFTHMINIFGADHAGYLKRLLAVVAALTKNQATLEIKVTQMVNFMDQGVPVRMSKRAGTFITFREVVERVGLDATRYMMISRHQDMALDFDFSAVLAQTKDNPIFYINYAHARIHSVLRHAAKIWPDFDMSILYGISLDTLHDEAEFHIIKVLSTWPRTIHNAVKYREPHRVANALYDIAHSFHGLWSKGKENHHLRFIDPDNKEVTMARLALIYQVATVLKTGLKILGIHAVEEMR